MKVAIPTDETKTQVCVSFGRAPYFTLHDTETGESQCLVNPAAEASGGAGIQAAQFVVDQKAEALITVRCGENAAEVFKAAGMKIYKAQGTEVAANCAALKAGSLEPLTRFHAGYHGTR